MNLIILIMTFNEEIHIKRCLESCLSVTKSIYIVDSYSTDKTTSIAKNMGAKVLYRPFDNHANQLNWSLKKLEFEAQWLLRIDADEIISENLKSELLFSLPRVKENIEGIYVNRNIVFLGKTIRHGSCYERKTMRLVRPKKAMCEDRLMDEHLLVKGKKINFKGSIYDHSLKPFTFWISKHNSYASKEAVEMIKLRKNNLDNKKTRKNKLPLVVILKNNIYSNLPFFLRPLIYFIYRYFIRLGFLDGKKGFIFHFMQSFWYRILVDVKIFEVYYFSKKNKKSLNYSVKKILDIDLKI